MTPTQYKAADSEKSAALLLLKRGLVSKSEAARLAGVSRQLMRHWSQGIEAEKARNAVISKLWRKAFKHKRKLSPEDVR